MKPDYQREGITLYRGDCLAVLPTLPANSVQCCITSPPYFALRSYLPAGHPDKPLEIGSESSVEAFVATMIDVFREVRRVLRDDGVLFLNLGDSYLQYNHNRGPSNGTLEGRRKVAQQQVSEGLPSSMPAGNLMNVPHRVAEALRADGWIWRQTIVWAKRSPMPESVAGWRWKRCRTRLTPGKYGHRDPNRGNIASSAHHVAVAQWIDCPGCPKCEANGGYVLRRGSGRCTTGHEYIFVLTKTGNYFWDSVASSEPASNRAPGNKRMPEGTREEMGGSYYRRQLGKVTGAMNHSVERRNPRTVWMLSSEPTKVRHFATYPSELVRRCLAAGVSAGGCCPHCGVPWAPVVESQRVATRPGIDNKICKHTEAEGNGQRSAASPNLDPQRHIAVTTTHGYRQTCNCPAHEAIGCVVLDPFSGIGTTGQTANHLGCRFVGVELHPDYFAESTRIIHEVPRWRKRQVAPKPKKRSTKAHPKQMFLPMEQ